MLWHKKKDGTPEAEAPVQYAGGVLNSFGSLPQKPSRMAKADAPGLRGPEKWHA